MAHAADEALDVILLLVNNNDLAVTKNLTTSSTGFDAAKAAQQSIDNCWTLWAKQMVALLAMEATSMIALSLECA